MHRVDDLAPLRAARDVRLVRHDDDAESRVVKTRHGFRNAGQDVEILDARRWIGLAVANDGPVDHTVAVKEHSAVADGLQICTRVSAPALSVP